MNYIHYIIDFLLQGGIVEIKGVGTLSLHSVPAQYNESNKTFSPASLFAFFSPQEAGNKDIIQYISEKDFISVETAEKFWESYCEAVKEKLDKEKKYSVEGLGDFFENEGKFTFEPTANLLDDNFGFQAIENIQTYSIEEIQKENILPKIESEKGEEVIQEQQDNELENLQKEEKILPEKAESIDQTVSEEMIPVPVEEKIEAKSIEQPENQISEKQELEEEVILSPVLPKEEEKAEDIPVPPPICEPPKLIDDGLKMVVSGNEKKRRKTVIIIRSIIILVILLVLLSCILFYYQVEKPDKLPVQQDTTQAEQPHYPIKDTNTYTAPEIPQQQTQSSDVEIRLKSKLGIDIISGFFLNKENAVKSCRQMQAMGYKAYIIERQPRGEKQYYVSLESFSTKNQAINFMRNVYKAKRIDLSLREWF